MSDHTPPWLYALSQLLKRRMLWVLIALGMLALVAILSPQPRLLALNRLVQDFIISAHERELKDDIVIVAIDDASIAALGRWPWRRTLHAELLDRINTGKPKAIGLDVIFAEPELIYPRDDAMLAAAIKRSAPVVLPVFLQTQGQDTHVVMPIPSIADNAHLGQAHINVDSDGIVRSVLLEYRMQEKTWDHFSVALLKAGGEFGLLDKYSFPANGLGSLPVDKPLSQARQALVPYAGGAGHFKRIPYIDVIQGAVPDSTFTGKYVLIGATAVGIADQYATPTTGKSNLMPGVEILANVMDGLLQKQTLTAATGWQNIALNLVFICIALMGFTLLKPLPALILTIASAIALFAASFFLASLTGTLFAPAAGILGLVFVYPLWSWHRLSTAADYLAVQLASFQQQGGLFFQRPNNRWSTTSWTSALPLWKVPPANCRPCIALSPTA